MVIATRTTSRSLTVAQDSSSAATVVEGTGTKRARETQTTHHNNSPSPRRRAFLDVVAPVIATTVLHLLIHTYRGVTPAAAAAAAPWMLTAFAPSPTRKMLITSTRRTESTVGSDSATRIQQLRFMAQPPAAPEGGAGATTPTSSEPIELDYLKAELTAYLAKRKEMGADEAAKRTVGTVVGGTKGNKILEYVSGAPNKETVLEDPPHPLDYDELVKYGFGHLVTRIMNAGGRPAMYELLGMDKPVVKIKQAVSAPPLVIDRTGESDPAVYRGLRLGQVLDDGQQALALQEVQQKIARGERPAASKVLEQVESFERPFADKRNTGPKQTPDWTVEQLDEWGRRQGRVEAWARKAKEGAFVNDPNETTDSLTAQQRIYSIVTVLTAATAFGKATPGFLALLMGWQEDNTASVLGALQIPAATLVLASLGSSIFCAVTSATLNRSRYVWTVKGFLGGPLTVRQLKTLPALTTQKEQDKKDQAKRQ